MGRIVRFLCYCLYYFGARHLPRSSTRRGGIWKRLRYLVCKPLFGQCGRNVNVESGAYFSTGEGIFIGDNSGIGIKAQLTGHIRIGKNVMMAPDVVIVTANHEFVRAEVPMAEQGFREGEPVVIEDDVWIGTRVIILPGVHVGSGAVIGAGAVVTRDVPDRAVAAGNPARVIRFRRPATPMQP
jgi:maltose O-acetyltransferase